MTIADQLLELSMIKTQLNDVLVSKGVDMADTPFNAYPAKVDLLSLGDGDVSGFYTDAFLKGEWDSNIHAQLQASTRVTTGMQIDYESIQPTDQVVEGIFLVNPSSVNRLVFTIMTNDMLDGEGNPVPAYDVDFGNGDVQEYFSNMQYIYNYDHAALDPNGFNGGDIEVRFKITPKPGATFLIIDLTYTFYNENGNVSLSSGISKLAINAPDMTDLVLSPYSYDTALTLRKLEEVYIGYNSVTDFSALFKDCVSLKSVVSLYTANGVHFTEMFENCTSLVTLPNFDDSQGMQYLAMFRHTPRLVTIPQMSMQNALDATMMFNQSGIVAVPDFNTFSSLTSGYGTVTAVRMFSECPNLYRLPMLDYLKIGNPDLMFFQSKRLTLFQLELNLNYATTVNDLFGGCEAISGEIVVRAPLAASATGMFAGCTKVQRIDIDLSQCSDITMLFSGCHSLRHINWLGLLQSGPTYTDVLSECWSLYAMTAGNPGIAISRMYLIGVLAYEYVSLLIQSMPVWDGVSPNQINYSQVIGLTLTATDVTALSSKGYEYTGSVT